MKLVLISLLLVSFLSCKKKKEFYLPYTSKVRVLGHGGMGNHYLHPMNSLPSLYTVLQIGADGTECDVQLTKDNKIVLFHNTDLDKQTQCEGVVSAKNWDEIQGCRYSWANSRKLPVMLLQDFMDKIDNKEQYTISLDVKLWGHESFPDGDLANRFAKAINDLAVKNNLSFNLMVESRDVGLLNSVKQLNPQIRVVYYPLTFQDAEDVSSKNNIDGIVIKYSSITKEEVEKLHEKGLFVTVFNMQSEADNKMALSLNVDYTESDKTKELLKDFGKYKEGHLNDWKDK